MSVQPVQIAVPQATLDDLRTRLARTRWPDEAEGAGWDYGTNLGYMQELTAYWQHSYDWRAQEAQLNQFAQLKTEIDGVELRFIHERGRGPNPLPLILFHDWPDSFYRYHKLIPLLTDPAQYGGDPADSFDVVVPTSLIGPTKGGPQPQMLRQVAQRCWRLMTEVLGHGHFAAGGGDGGSALSQLLAVDHPASMIGIHLTDIGFHATRAQHPDLSEAEQQFLAAIQRIGFQEGAYAMLQGTRPQTLVYGLNDSPVGWAAWVIEKFRSWSDCDGDLEKSFTKDELLTNIMLHWVAGIDPRGYREEWVSPSLKPEQPIDVPVGLALPPKDLTPVPPRAFAERNLKNIQHWTVLPRGGHFVAMEDPKPLAEDMRAFFRPLRAAS
jgi:pimeloyl-ACP methyl ester carboxylesterase